MTFRCTRYQNLQYSDSLELVVEIVDSQNVWKDSRRLQNCVNAVTADAPLLVFRGAYRLALPPPSLCKDTL